MKVPYRKMHGAGNLILVVDARDSTTTTPSTETLRQLGDERSGPGFDQLMWVESAKDADAAYRVFNNDGSEVEQCGNGVRCVARYLANGEARDLTLRGPAGPIEARVRQDGLVTVSMGSPKFEPAAVPFNAPAAAEQYFIEIDGQDYEIGIASMGNPHCVLRVADLASAPVARLGPRFETHVRFPERTNVGFMEIRDRKNIGLRVHERGVGETMACGTGACAAVVVGQRLGLLDTDVRVALPGGELMVSWRGGDDPVWLTGNAERIGDGVINLED